MYASSDLESCFFQAEDGIRDLVRSRGLGDVYKRQALHHEDAHDRTRAGAQRAQDRDVGALVGHRHHQRLSLIHI